MYEMDKLLREKLILSKNVFALNSIVLALSILKKDKVVYFIHNKDLKKKKTRSIKGAMIAIMHDSFKEKA